MINRQELNTMTDEELDKLVSRLLEKIEDINETVLIMSGEMVKKIGKLCPTETNKLQRILASGTDITRITHLLTKTSKTSMDEIEDIYLKAAQDNYSFAEQFYRYRGIDYVPFQKNRPLQRIIKAVAKQTSNEFENLSKTTVFALKTYQGNIRYVPIKKAYKELIDNAVIMVQNGVTNYQSAIRNILKQYADSGIRTVQYESGYSRRLDTAVRQNIIDGVKQINLEVQNLVGKEYGSDGKEISVHNTCAPDHLPFQGHQFKNEEFDKLQSARQFKDINEVTFSPVKRPIGQWNCRHFAFPIILGVSSPVYTKKQLQKIREENNKKITIQGKQYTLYEATQEQRKLETAIRYAKDRSIIAKASGDNTLLLSEQMKLTDLTRQYKSFSKAAGLSVKQNRTNVIGYQRFIKN